MKCSTESTGSSLGSFNASNRSNANYVNKPSSWRANLLPVLFLLLLPSSNVELLTNAFTFPSNKKYNNKYIIQHSHDHNFRKNHNRQRPFSFSSPLSSNSSSSSNSSKSKSKSKLTSNEALQDTTPSLSEMEDAVELTLESNQQVNLSKSTYDFTNSNNNNNNNNQNQNQPILQHTIRAPTTSSSSSNTFGMQESSFENEDEEARKRQSFINQYLEEDDENWKRERLERILGKYKDVLVNDNDDGSNDGSSLEDRWRTIIDEEKKRIENGM